MSSGKKADKPVIEKDKSQSVEDLGESKEWNLRLYVAGQTPKSLAALANLQKVCEEHMAGNYRIEVIDLSKNPQLARGDEIVALPTLVRKLPEPVRKIIGDLSNKEKVLVGLQLRSRGSGNEQKR